MVASATIQGVSPETTKVPARRFYRPELDAMRFFAFMAVFVHHVRLRSGFDVPDVGTSVFVGAVTHALGVGEAFKASLSAGVSLFFFLSSYLITTLLVFELRRTGTVHIPSFFLRRALRIWPLYFAYLGFIALLGVWVVYAKMRPSEGLFYTIFLGNWYVVRHDWPTGVLIGMLWSISIEEQFYLLAPFSVMFFKERGLMVFSVLSVVLCCGVLLWFGQHGIRADHIVRPNTFVQGLPLVGGTITALLLGGRVWRCSAYGRVALGCVGLVCWFAAYFRFGPESGNLRVSAPLMDYLLILAGVVAIFFAFLGVQSRHVPGWLTYLGRISYGLYVFHMLALWLLGTMWKTSSSQHLAVLARNLLSLAVTILLASASYRFLESPFLTLKERFTFVKSRAV